jgi:uncharacterized protein
MKTTKRLFHILLTLLPALVGTAAEAAGFDCTLAQGKVETMICADSSVSKLDEQLNAIYVQFRKTSGSEKAEKALQIAWLKNRDNCDDLTCLQRVYAARIAELQARSASASPLVGIWKKEYSCAEATGIYEERCQHGEHDVFELAIQVNGDRICVAHFATGQLGNRVDNFEGFEPSMTGKVSGKAATVRFQSARGGTGTALLRAEGNTLHWKVSAKDKGESWIPDTEALQRVPAGRSSHLPKCGR